MKAKDHFELQFRWCQIALFLLVLSGIFFLTLPQALADSPAEGTFFQWVDQAGVLSFTNDIRNIPKLYQGQAEERRFSEIDVNLTKVEPIEADLPVPRVLVVPLQPTPTQPCQAPTRVKQKWQRVRGADGHLYRRLISSVVEGCGEVSYEGSSEPLVQLNR